MYRTRFNDNTILGKKRAEREDKNRIPSHAVHKSSSSSPSQQIPHPRQVLLVLLQVCECVYIKQRDKIGIAACVHAPIIS